MLKTWYFPYSGFWSTGQLEGLQPPRWLRYWFYASISLLFAVELERLWCINFISVKLFECYYGPLVACVDTCWCYLKGDINCNLYYYYYCSSVQREQQYKTVKAQTRLLKIILYFFALVLFVQSSSWFTKHLISYAKS